MARIQILGIGCKKSRALKANLMTALERTGVDASVEEVTEVNRILQFQILSAPALFINGELFYQGVAPEVEELEHLLRNYVRQTGGLRRILSPVDFSATAANAFRYALKLAVRRNAGLEPLHVYHPSFDQDDPYHKTSEEESRRRKESRLRDFVANNQVKGATPVATGIQVEPSVAVGLPGEEIVRRSAESNLIVMGAKGRGGVLERIFGSTASEVARKANCPVLLVPPDVSFRDFRTVLFATDGEEADESLPRWFSGLMGDMPTHIHFVHTATREGADYAVLEAISEPAVRNQLPGLDFRVVTLECEDALEGLTRYAGDQRADLIVMSIRHRRFLEQLFHPSLCRRMVPASAFPLLVVHKS